MSKQQAGFFLSRNRLIISGAIVVGLCVIIGVATYFGTVNSNTAIPADKGSDSAASKDSSDFIPGTEPWMNLHLPSYTVPKHYDLTLYPDFYGENSHFYGNVTIEIEVKQATFYLLVHYKYLTITAKSIKDKKGNDYGIAKISYYEKNQFFITRSQQLINESTTVLLELQFDGSLSQGIVGFYKAFYDGKTKAMATSKFEPVDARKAFPCFDEPNLKATFTTTLIHKPSFIALSNMPLLEETLQPAAHYPELVASKFQKSVPMSTYLACFIVCDCEYEETILESGKKFRVYAVKGRKDQLSYSLQFGANVTNYFEKYFSLDYPLPKMDMIAIPNFVSGAMEHWGLITYRETNLLYKEGVSSPSNKQRIAEVVAHELAHQWFGNIVTMDWWDDLWLNEGFATFMSYVGTEVFEPGFDIFTQFPAIEAYGVMDTDAKATSHPIIVPVNRPEEITAVFDAISYNKGASVIRMLETLVGKETFKEALKQYLRRFQYGNAKTYQLWETIGEVAGMDVTLIMDTWTKQSGYPVVTVKLNRTNNSISASQELFKPQKTADQNDWLSSEFNYGWEIPLRFVSSQNGSHLGEQLHYNKVPVEFASPVDITDTSVWIKLNDATIGYYKVNYETAVWIEFYNVLNTSIEVMKAADRAGLAYDSMTLASAGYLNYATALQFIKFMKKEEHYVPWLSVSSELYYIRNVLNNAKWNEFVQDLIDAVYSKLGWTTNVNDPHLDKLLRGTAIRLACGHNSTKCINEAKRQFRGWLSGAKLDSAVRRDVFTYGMSDVSESIWDEVWNKYTAEELASTKSDIRRGLARNTEPVIISKLLNYTLDPDKVADQDFFTMVSRVAANPVGNPIVWQWVQENYAQIENRFGRDHRYFGRMVPGIVSRFSTEAQLAEVQAFFNKFPEAGAGESARKQAIESVETNVQWKMKFAYVVCSVISDDCNQYPQNSN